MLVINNTHETEVAVLVHIAVFFHMKYCGELENLFDPRGWEWCLRQASKSIFGITWPWPFYLVTPKVDHFMSLHHGPLVPFCIKIGSFVFTSIVYNKRTDGRTDGQADRSRTLCLHLSVLIGRAIKNLDKTVFGDRQWDHETDRV